MGRRQGSVNISRIEFNRLYDKYAEQYTDPVEFMYQVMAGKLRKVPPAVRVTAAATLIAYKFPKPVMPKEDEGAQASLELVWSDGHKLVDQQ